MQAMVPIGTEFLPDGRAYLRLGMIAPELQRLPDGRVVLAVRLLATFRLDAPSPRLTWAWSCPN